LADSLVMRFVKDHFDEYRESTIGGKYKLLITFESWSSFFLSLSLFLSFRFLYTSYEYKGGKG